MHKVFVYGTLKKGYGNHRLLVDSTFIGNAVTKQRYHLTASGIPFVNKTIPTSNIVGEVYEVTDKQLDRLDSLEGYDPNRHEESWYKREKIEVNLESGETMESYIYFNPQVAPTVIESGNYDDYRKQLNK
jgi:gamma-glutamylcyclotransferase (GGCT)/AIG2-like uncharacterized protein YtfP